MIMTDFDKLIKEKTEQASYAYKPSAWSRFRRFAGSSSPVRHWVMGSVSAVVLGGAVLTAVHFSQKQPQPEVTGQVGLTADSALVGTAPQVVAVETDTCQVQTTLPEKPVTARQYPSNVPNSAKKAADPCMERSDAGHSTTSEASPVRLGRPVVIDVDTIKENVPSDEELRKGNSRLF